MSPSLLVFLLVLVPVASLAQPVAERLREIEREMAEARDRAEGARTEQTSVLGEIEALDREVETRRKSLDLVESRRAEAARAAATAQEELAAIEAQLASTRALVGDRLRGLYRLGSRGWGAVVFRAPGEISDALRFQRYLTAILDRDRNLLDELALRHAAAETARTEAEAATARLAEVVAERKAALAEVREVRDEKEKLVASLEEESEAGARLAEELEDAAEALRRTLEEATRRPAAPLPEGFVLPVGGVPRGIVVARNGVEIRTREGEAIVAIGGGRVVFADWFPGYGQMIIVDHGGHLHSIYGYADAITTRRGVTVDKGEVLGRVGRTGPAAVSALYFEVRRRGRPEPPGDLLPGLAAR